MTEPSNAFGSRKTFTTSAGEHVYYDLNALTEAGLGEVSRLPYCLRVLLESLLRNVDGFVVEEDDVKRLMSWKASAPEATEIPFKPGRVVLQDFTGVPCVVDLAAMRAAMSRMGGDPGLINPLVPCDLVIDHSVQVDAFASSEALAINAEKEFARNGERYEFLKWGEKALANFSVVPPATGIVHQVNLEYLAKGVLTTADGVAYPDSLVGTDSHTTMINGLGVVGWGVGGIEAEAVMLGQAVYLLTPRVVGFELKGKLAQGATATDLVLTVTQMLRAHGVVEQFVEFFGEGLASLSLPDRATLANMAPEYGATIGFCPVDGVTLDYMRLTGRSEAEVELVETYYGKQGMIWSPDAPVPEFSERLSLDMSEVEPCLAGPKRPQDRITLANMKSQWRKDVVETFGRQSVPTIERADQQSETCSSDGAMIAMDGRRFSIHDGDVVIAAITSCTNTSNPDVLIAAGLVARKARSLGLDRRPWVKSSLAPGSKVVKDYLEESDLLGDLEHLGFHIVGYGCTTCIGNSGPLRDEIARGIGDKDLVATSVLSGNRNFEGRISPHVKANYLASPPLVVAYALAGTTDIDLAVEPLGTNHTGKEIYLKDVWPTLDEVRQISASCVTREQFETQYGSVYDGNETWNEVAVSGGALYEWSDASTYIQEPPFFVGMTEEAPGFSSIEGARCLVMAGDSVTTDHISPAGPIAEDSPAGRFLVASGVSPSDFNSYGSRRGNDRVMTRGTFANIRVKNLLTAEPLGSGKGVREGWWTRDFSDAGGSEVAPTYEVAQNYAAASTPLVVLGGKDYGMGSSRDWAAKGTILLGVRAVIAESFERIHRSNLVGMGVLPLVFKTGESASSHGFDGSEVFDITLPETLEPRSSITVKATRTRGDHEGETVTFETTCRVDTPVEVVYFANGGILQTVLRRILKESKGGSA